MDVMKPEVIDLEGRCYRKMPVAGLRTADSRRQPVAYVEDIHDDDLDFDGIEESHGRFVARLSVPSVLFKFIIGKRGETKQRLERDTRTKVTIPKVGKEGDIVISGESASSVAKARSRVRVLVEGSRNRLEWTHLLNIPLNVESVKERVVDFRVKVLEKCGQCRGVDESVFQNPDKFHLTLAVLKLLSEEEIKQAVQELNSCRQLVDKILGGKPAKMRLRGLEYMNDDPAEVHVLYAKVHLTDESYRLQELSDELVKRLSSSGFVEQSYDYVKLHATVMNSKYRRGYSQVKGGQPGGRHVRQEREAFDARQILEDFADFDMGELQLENIFLSERKGSGSDGYYNPVSSLKLA